jgi:hypothetical protein
MSTNDRPPDNLAREREERGSRAGSRRHPPYVPEHDEDEPLQQEHPSPDDVPVLPANAGGKDKFTPDEQREEIDEESMYDGRPERAKDDPPSERT